MHFPFVSVIIVNYNGARYLPDCLDALRVQSYPADGFEVIVSDNGSTDGSLELLRSKYPWVRVLMNDRNIGFASGNNVAINAARGQYVVLLNNDTVASRAWLESLIAVAESDARAGMVTGRLQLFYHQLTVTLIAGTFIPQGDTRALGVQVFSVDSGAPGGTFQYLDGFYGWENASSGRRFRWTKDVAHLGVPVPAGVGEWRLRLSLAAPRPNDGVRVSIAAQDTPIADWIISGREPSEYEFTMPSTTRSRAVPLVQNTGSLIFRDASGRDRGTFVRDAEVFYEVDEEQYNCVEEVFAGCGASLLIRKTMLQGVGLLDDDFFMYYEDTDLAWRARLRGWKVLYAPQAIVRHVHCGTSEEWSPFFIYHTDRNRLAMLLKNGTPRQVLREWSKYAARVIGNALKAVYAALLRQSDWRARARRALIQFRVLGALFRWLPALWRKRRWVQKTRTVSPADLAIWFAD